MSARHHIRQQPTIRAAAIALFLALCLSACVAETTSVSKPTAPAARATAVTTPHYIYVGVQNINGNGGYAVDALQARDGSLRWHRPISGGASPISILVSADTIIAVQVTQLTALRASDGTILWQSDTNYYNIRRAIAIDGMIIESIDSTSHSDSYVDAYRISDGKRLWEYDGNTCNLGQIVEDTTRAQQVGAPAAHAVYIARSCSSEGSSGILALRVSDGTVLWHNQLAKSLQLNTPALANGVLYVNTFFGDIFAIRPSDGSQLWHAQLSSASSSDTDQAFFSSIVTDETTGYIAANFNLFTFRLRDGTQLWTKHYRHRTDIAKAADGVVYLLQEGTGLHLLRASDGSEIWGTASADAYSYPAASADTVYVIHGPPPASAVPTPYAVYALKSTDGSMRWSHDAGGYAFTSLATD